MNLPTVIAALVQAQNNFEHSAYADCFSETAIVHDEGEDHQGRAEIREWIKTANEKYKTQLEPLDFVQTGRDAVLTSRVTGTFDGSPAIHKYHLELSDDLIQSFRVTG
jgi:hypothetical protein